MCREVIYLVEHLLIVDVKKIENFERGLKFKNVSIEWNELYHTKSLWVLKLDVIIKTTVATIDTDEDELNLNEKTLVISEKICEMPIMNIVKNTEKKIPH